MATTNFKRAQDMLFGTDGLSASNFKMFPGSSRDATAEQIAGEIADVIERIAAGDFEEVSDCEG